MILCISHWILLGRDGKRENHALPWMGFRWDGFSWEMKKENRGKKGNKREKEAVGMEWEVFPLDPCREDLAQLATQDLLHKVYIKTGANETKVHYFAIMLADY